MTDFQKKLLGFATFWPVGYMFLFFGFIFMMILSGPGDGVGVFSGLAFVLFMVLHFLTIFLILGLQIYYIVHAVKNELISQNGKIAWIVAFFFGGMIAMPIYWYISIWKTANGDITNYGSLTGGDNFESAYPNEQDYKTSEPVPREPHTWR